jgi:hypothetical protein
LLCRLALNPSDDDAFERVFNIPARRLGKGLLDKLQDHKYEALAAANLNHPQQQQQQRHQQQQQQGQDLSLFSIAQRLLSQGEVAALHNKRLGEFLGTMEALSSMAVGASVPDLIELVLKNVPGLAEFLKERKQKQRKAKRAGQDEAEAEEEGEQGEGEGTEQQEQQQQKPGVTKERGAAAAATAATGVGAGFASAEQLLQQHQQQQSQQSDSAATAATGTTAATAATRGAESCDDVDDQSSDAGDETSDEEDESSELLEDVPSAAAHTKPDVVRAHMVCGMNVVWRGGGGGSGH